MTFPSPSCFETWNSLGLRSIPSLLQRKLPVGWARSTRGQAALLEQEKAVRRMCRRVCLYIAAYRIHVCAYFLECIWWALRLRSGTHPCRELSLLFCWPRKALTRCYEGVNFSTGCRRGHIRNIVMSLSATEWRAIRPHDTRELSSLSNASDHYIDSPTGSSNPLQKGEP